MSSNFSLPASAQFDEDDVRLAIESSNAEDKDELLKLFNEEMKSSTEADVELSQNLQRRLATLFALEEQYQEKDVSASALRLNILQEEKEDDRPALSAEDEADIAEIFAVLEKGQAEILQELEKNAKKATEAEENTARESDSEDYRKIMEKLKQKNA